MGTFYSMQGVDGDSPRSNDTHDEWTCAEDELFRRLRSTPMGLGSEDASRRAKTASEPIGVKRNTGLQLALRQFSNPIVMILLAVAVVSGLLGEPTQAFIVVCIVVASAVLGFTQERGALRAVESLLDTVKVHADALRDGRETEVLVAEVVPGDVVVLRAGDVVPGDGRVVSSNQLQLDEAALTGESFPRRKEPGALDGRPPLALRSNMVHYGTYVASGEGRVLITRTGADTEFGRIADVVAARHLPTAFERGVTDFGYMLMRATAVLVAGIFIVNVVARRPLVDSVLFSLALAVGLTPQMLPAIVTFSLSRGAVAMARRKVIVKRLDAIEDVGSLDILCTDKTGTITVGSVMMRDSLDYMGAPDPSAVEHAWLTARFQHGFRNPLDDAILAGSPGPQGEWRCLGEVPFDFVRKRMSVVVESGNERLLVVKGALEPLLDRCADVLDGDQTRPLSEERSALMATFERLSAEGLRVLGVARKTVESGGDATESDEDGLTFIGFLTFADPIKPGVLDAVRTLAGMGVGIRLITGDNRHAAAYVAKAIGLDPTAYATGAQLDAMTDDQMEELVKSVEYFAETDPIHKARIIGAYSRVGHTVGFLGDGINDSPALHAADVGISVDGAVDVAKRTADLVLLNKDLAVLASGIEQGRRIFANTLKYVHVTTSANFGNMLSLAAATLFLPFLPLLPLQILLLNFLSDIPGVSIATDNVDDEQVRRPRTWNIANVRSFMIVFGLVSTCFDLLTFAVLRLGFGADETLLRSGWFVESMLTELAVLLMLRTTRPVWRSHPGSNLVWSSLLVGATTLLLPYLPIAEGLGLTGPPARVMMVLLAITFAYMATTELLKRRMAWLIDESVRRPA